MSAVKDIVLAAIFFFGGGPAYLLIQEKYYVGCRMGLILINAVS